MFFDLFFNSVWAQDATGTGAAPSGPGGLVSFIPFILIFAIFYFLMIRPQKRRLQEEQTMLKSLGKGDEIFTKSGILGKVIGLTDKVITLEVAEGVRLKVLKAQIGGLTKRLFDKEKKK